MCLLFQVWANMAPTSGTRPLGAQQLPRWENKVQEKVSAGAGSRGRAAGKARKVVATSPLMFLAGVEECLILDNENPFFRACYEWRFGWLKTGILGLTLPFIHSGTLSESVHPLNFPFLLTKWDNSTGSVGQDCRRGQIEYAYTFSLKGSTNLWNNWYGTN